MEMTNVGVIYLLVVGLGYVLAWQKDREKASRALGSGVQTLLNLLPLLLAIFALVGLFQEFLPADLIETMLGRADRLSSLVMGGLLGAVSIGPPLASYPIAGTLLAEGAWPPAVAAFILSWISVGVVTLPFEAQVFTWRFALIRNFLTLIMALLAGLMLGGVL